jgi:hypothetical protein
MPGLRKSGARHRGVRPGLLTAGLSIAGPLSAGLQIAGLRIALLLGAALTLFSGCWSPPPAAPVGSWFQLQGGAFQPVTDPGAARPVPRAPWTVQSRVADMAFLGDELYCGVNGSGLAALGRDPAGGLHFTDHSDPLIFAHRTITTIVPREGGLTVHLYYNAMLNDVLPPQLSLAGISLVAFAPKVDDYSFLVPPFQRKNPDWEAVGFAPESQNSFDFEWKFTDASETRFQYTRFHADTRSEESEDRDTFLAALGVPSIDGPSVPVTLAAFFAACRAELPPLAPGASLVFSLRSHESPIKRSYRSRKESESASVVPVFEEQGTLLALLPDRRVISAASGEKPNSVRLPRLPQGFQYTDLVKWGGSLVIPWEEVSFTDVARAGILVYSWPAR